MDKNMKQARLAALALTIAFSLIGCHGNNQEQAAQDPAQVNQAPAGGQAPSPNQSETGPEQPAAPAESQPESPCYSSENSSPQYCQPEAAQEASQPPPPLPEYDQPQCPAPNYIWTPGYWAWGPAGYYWVPGVWVASPYVGALWTPGYWGFLGAVYLWHRGYWGPYIGYYGGINYGFGYFGVGFQGGYWSNNGFRYNRAITNINTTTITNVYNYSVANNTIIDKSRVSYNGGAGGVRYQPSRAEMAAGREPRVAALPAQMQVVRAAAANRGQFASVNRGRPQMAAMANPVVVRPITPPAAAVNPGARRAARTAPAGGAPRETRAVTPAYRTAAPTTRSATSARRAARTAPAGGAPRETRAVTPAYRPAAPTTRSATSARRAARTAPAGGAPRETRSVTPAYRPAAPATRSATSARPRTRAPARSPNRAATRREAPATRPAQRAPARPATRAPARPSAPRETQTRKAPPRQPPPRERKQETRPN